VEPGFRASSKPYVLWIDILLNVSIRRLTVMSKLRFLEFGIQMEGQLWFCWRAHGVIE